VAAIGSFRTKENVCRPDVEAILGAAAELLLSCVVVVAAADVWVLAVDGLELVALELPSLAWLPLDGAPLLPVLLEVAGAVYSIVHV
jgi:hypothetical protein